MPITSHNALVSRNAILKLLSDAEVARVSTAESAPVLAAGQDYIDLEDLDRGIQRAGESKTPTIGHILPRSAVAAATWDKISALMGSDAPKT